MEKMSRTTNRADTGGELGGRALDPYEDDMETLPEPPLNDGQESAEQE